MEIGKHTYSIGRLSTFKQLHVARKLAPLLSVLSGFKLNEPEPEAVDDTTETAVANFERFVGPVAKIFASMSDEEVEAIVGVCLSVVRRQLPGGTGFAPIWNANAGDLQFDDIGLPEMMRLTFAVLQENIGGFLPVSIGASPAPV